MAHRATMDMGGHTIAVLGHGFNYLYPAENRILATQMAEHQLLMTEYPPYMKPENGISQCVTESLVVYREH